MFIIIGGSDSFLFINAKHENGCDVNGMNLSTFEAKYSVCHSDKAQPEPPPSSSVTNNFSYRALSPKEYISSHGINSNILDIDVNPLEARDFGLSCDIVNISTMSISNFSQHLHFENYHHNYDCYMYYGYKWKQGIRQGNHTSDPIAPFGTYVHSRESENEKGTSKSTFESLWGDFGLLIEFNLEFKHYSSYMLSWLMLCLKTKCDFI